MPKVKDALFRSLLLEESVYGESEAIKWANGFSFPQSVIDNSVQLFRSSNCSLVTMVNKLFKDLSVSRLSVTSIRSNIAVDNPELPNLLSLVEGMPLLCEPSFIPNSVRGLPTLSRVYKRVHSAVDRMLFNDFVSPGLAFVIPRSLLVEAGVKFHGSRLSWTTKHGRPCGRPITDCSAGVGPLNSVYTKEESDSRWGIITHPSIADFVEMIGAYFESVRGFSSWDQLTLWKVDLKGAYTLLSFKPDDVPFMAAQTKDDLMIFFLCGVFGWTGTPAAFQVVSRAIKFQINRLISGIANVYVDDIVGVSLVSNVISDVAIVTKFLRALFNSNCVEDSKTEISKRMTVIGYVIDLESSLVSVSERNFLRVIHGLSTLELSPRVCVRKLQRFGSWISRYSYICVFLRPLARLIHRSYSQHADRPDFLIDLPDFVIRSLRIFRAIFLSAFVDEKKFTRSIPSFLLRVPSVVVEFDASLFGGGILLFDSHETCVGACSFSLKSLNFDDDSSYQNCAEYITALVGLLLALRYLPVDGPRAVVFRGDSVSALTWLHKGSPRSDLVRNASVVLVHICHLFDVIILNPIHVGASNNTSADALSRGGVLNDLIFSDPRIQSNTLRLVPYDLPKLLDLCNPLRNVLDSDVEFVDHWREISGYVHAAVDNSLFV